MREAFNEFVKRDAVVLAIGPDRPTVFRMYWAKEGLPFAGLADPGHKVANRYEQEVALLKLGRMPALMVVDREGRVRFAHYAENMRDYPSVEELLGVIDELREEKPHARGDRKKGTKKQAA